MKNIGFACKLIGVPNTNTRTCLLGKADTQTLLQISKHNIDALQNMVDYCNKVHIKLFRISSDIIPLASHPQIKFDWQNALHSELTLLGQKINETGLRVSMHPGQYTVLNSPSEEVVYKAQLDLAYHANFLDALMLNSTHKMVLHIGGVYGNKPDAIERFIKNYQALPDFIKARLVLENDDKSYSIAEVLDICRKVNAPAVFDVFHHSIVPSPAKNTLEWLDMAISTWNTKDGIPKIHYSEQLEGGKAGMHSYTIKASTFSEFYRKLGKRNVDIMLEVKDKNLSALKCIHCTTENLHIKHLQEAWARYKYAVLARNQKHYQVIRQLFTDSHITAIEFYTLCEEALALQENSGNAVNAAQHVFGYFKNKATQAEKNAFDKLLLEVEKGMKKPEALPKKLLALAEKYKEDYLLDSLYLYGV